MTAGSSTALTETALKDGLQQAWSCGGDVATICVGPSLYNNDQRLYRAGDAVPRRVDRESQAQIIGAADVYVSRLRVSHTIRLTRYCQVDTLFWVWT